MWIVLHWSSLLILDRWNEAFDGRQLSSIAYIGAHLILESAPDKERQSCVTTKGRDIISYFRLEVESGKTGVVVSRLNTRTSSLNVIIVLWLILCLYHNYVSHILLLCNN